MIEIYVFRHGEAEPRDAGVVDADRALTRRGKNDVRAVLKVAKKAITAPQLILTSPLRRARETAEIAATVFRGCPVVASDRLKPSAAAQGIWKEIGEDPKLERVVVVGHEPHLSHLVSFLLEAPISLDVKKGGLIRIDCPDRLTSPRGVLKWVLTPKLARSL